MSPDIETECELTIATPECIEGLGPAPRGTQRLVVTQLGDFSADTLIRDGRVHDMLPMPVSTFSAIEAVERVLGGRARGAALLEMEQAAPSIDRSYAGQAILVVDDSPVNREVVVQALRRFDVEPTVAENGLEAIAVAKDRRFDLIFMDCSMPEMDGFEATRIIRRDELENRGDRTPVIALTAHTADHVSERWKEAGMDGIVVKPFTMSALGACLTEWLGLDEPAPTRENAEADEDAATGVLDRDAQDNLRDILGDMFDQSFARILRLYADTAPTAFDTLLEAADAENWSNVSAAAHALKSITANATATGFADICARLETAANAGDEKRVAALMERAKAEYDRTRDAVDAMLQDLGAGSAEEVA
ncbi:response regulator [Nitratireductor sp. XY-223]|uniref:response regulator n=1 Tax=Nitratireductor sp. XY-223 TaxID=2561926 RepID=UPI0010AB472F|nr:response regulator [Nitratireductor sp. XY-223]